MTTFAARHLALGDDPEPEGPAPTWGEDAVPRRALPPEDVPATYATYLPGPELMPFADAAQADHPLSQASPSEFGGPAVAPGPSRTMEWRLSYSSSAPRDPGPADATLPGPSVVDPASLPTPVSHFAAISYQSMASPAYGIAAPYVGPVTAPYGGGRSGTAADTASDQKPVGPEIE